VVLPDREFGEEEDFMPRKIYKAEEIIAKLRQVEVLTSQGQATAAAGIETLRRHLRDLIDCLEG
jgi:hypothetical protein